MTISVGDMFSVRTAFVSRGSRRRPSQASMSRAAPARPARRQRAGGPRHRRRGAWSRRHSGVFRLSQNLVRFPGRYGASSRSATTPSCPSSAPDLEEGRDRRRDAIRSSPTTVPPGGGRPAAACARPAAGRSGPDRRSARSRNHECDRQLAASPSGHGPGVHHPRH